MKKMLKRLCTGFLALATVVTALPTTPVHAESKQYWTESKERVGIVEKVMNDGSIGSTFNEGHLTVEGEDAYCIDINTDFKNGYKTRADASTRMSADQISDVALSIEYVKQYTDSHSGISKNHAYLLRQLVVWQRLSVHLGWQCDNVRASYNEIPKSTQDEVFAGAKAFVKENKGRYECGGYIYSGEGQELGQFWAKLNVGNAKLQKTSSNASITDGNEMMHGGIIPVSVPPEVPLREFPYNAVVELVNPVADTVSRKTYTGADVDWYVKAEDIVLKNKGNQNAGNPQNHVPQGQMKK